MLSPETGSLYTSLLAASSAFSSFGWVYMAIPVLVLLAAAILCSTPTCRTFWLFVSGAAAGIAALILVVVLAENTGPKVDKWIPLAANVAVCFGAVAGVLFFRVVHRFLRCGRMHNACPDI